ncbi:MAG: nucleotidyltransferase [Bacilli bacterium]|nr:nucleotidyltransferase [Bacilli bacterium]
MKVVGVVVEYNPFHYGHLYHLKTAKSLTNADLIIGVISTYFVQRGEPSILPLHKRISDALDSGVNLIVELPFIYSVESADIFAKYSLQILEALKCNEFVFGSESGDTKEFMKKYNSKTFTSPRIDEIIKKYLKEGYSYPKASSLAHFEISNYYLDTPNDILGNSYIKAIEKYKYNLSPIIIKRINEKNCSSASKIRKLMIKNEKAQVTKYTPIKYLFEDVHDFEKYFPLLKYKLQTSSSKELENIHLISEGIHNLFKKNIDSSNSMEEFISKCTSKRYSSARIKRTIIHILVSTPKEDAKTFLQEKIPFVRVLGFDKLGQKYLNKIRKEVAIPIISNFAGKDSKIHQLEKKAVNVYYSIDKEPQKTINQNKYLHIFPIIK